MNIMNIDNATASLQSLARLSPVVLELGRDVTDHVNELTGMFVAPETTILVAIVATSFVLCCSCTMCSLASRAKRQKRLRENALIVKMAEHAPVDDADEHEEEKHSHTRGAAPGDSDAEEDSPNVFTRC